MNHTRPTNGVASCRVDNEQRAEGLGSIKEPESFPGKGATIKMLAPKAGSRPDTEADLIKRMRCELQVAVAVVELMARFAHSYRGYVCRRSSSAVPTT